MNESTTVKSVYHNDPNAAVVFSARKLIFGKAWVYEVREGNFGHTTTGNVTTPERFQVVIRREDNSYTQQGDLRFIAGLEDGGFKLWRVLRYFADVHNRQKQAMGFLFATGRELAFPCGLSQSVYRTVREKGWNFTSWCRGEYATS